MTQEEKDILLRDLCARLPYKVKLEIKNVGKICTLEEIDTSWEEMSVSVRYKNGELYGYDFDFAKPYLFPLSSMTEEQINDCPIGETNLNIIKSNTGYGIIEIPWLVLHLFIDWCNKNHFDYRGLIPMGLANDATGLNIY